MTKRDPVANLTFWRAEWKKSAVDEKWKNNMWKTFFEFYGDEEKMVRARFDKDDWYHCLMTMEELV